MNHSNWLKTFVIFASISCASATQSSPIVASSARSFLNTIGMNIHIDQGAMSPTQIGAYMRYVGARSIRPGDATKWTGSALTAWVSDYMTVLNGIPFSTGLWPMGSAWRGTSAYLIAWENVGTALATAGKLLAFEGPNEPNNQGWQVTFNGVTGGWTNSWVPVAQLQAALYSTIHGSTTFHTIPIINTSNIDYETDNVGLQWATAMPDGPTYTKSLSVRPKRY
jgi:hypothetical protein